MRLISTVGKILAALVVLALALAGGGYLWLRRSLPQTSGSAQVSGISAPVTITRDADGVPHIRGQSEADALFGLGYAHAQDRLWQMEIQRRIGNGRLSEVFGETTLSTDKFLRTLGVGRAAASAAAALPPETRALLDAYVGGINAFVAGHRDALPVE
ncbi:MAG: penicillin acylase family protein, partial [Oscillochloris sp.]|nr:penicillin acylase family protein [Oscillochloris sp.]